jgi:uncharacterized protein
MVKKRKIPLRMCLGCQEMKPKREMMRVVRTPENKLVLDSTGKKSGRGAYVCPTEACFAAAIKGKRLEKALECQVTEQLLDDLKKELE